MTMPDGHAVTLTQETDDEFIARVKPHLADIEKIREKNYALYRSRCKRGIIILLLAAPFIIGIDYVLLFTQWVFRSQHAILAGFILLVPTGGIYLWATTPKIGYEELYKHQILPRIAAALGLSAYKEHGKIPEDEMLPSDIMPVHNYYHSEDYFEGTYKGASVRFAEIKLAQEAPTENNGDLKPKQTVFAGLALLVAMPHGKFTGQTVVLCHHVASEERAEAKDLNMEKVDLVDPKFNRLYGVFTTDQVEARYLLDPAMMERVENLKAIYNAYDVKISYYDDKVLVLLSCDRNLFAPPAISVPATDIETLTALKKEVEKALDLIDCVDAYLQKPHNAPAQK